MTMLWHLILWTLSLVSSSWTQVPVLDEEAAIAYLEEYDKLAADINYQYGESVWKYQTNITDATLANMHDNDTAISSGSELYWMYIAYS
ncbi:hypothetical protein CHS0354_019654 [Potamilus streckersoni]|uniref:Uncharacterized protein n=1 Tax=Potamilus streckersoni TaxID=2493646 RepID=A0AAE0T903_9BIVA|nr:hypothetical protein CHS0354_019654 [Potamilus streckersoni]